MMMSELRDEYERRLQAVKADAAAELRELEWELAEWERLACALEDAYKACNGQLTDELREAIEALIAHLPDPSAWL
jgi:hypothetical protein